MEDDEVGELWKEFKNMNSKFDQLMGVLANMNKGKRYDYLFSLGTPLIYL